MAGIYYIIMNIIICTIYVSLYGCMRALISLKLGDRSKDVKSRLNLSPRLHIDSIGFIFMVLYNVGFIKPMKNQALNFKNKKGAVVLVALLPPIIMFTFSSIIMWVFLYFAEIVILPKGVYVFGLGGEVVPLIVIEGIVKIIQLSVGVLIYNLIPIYPLEYERVLNYSVSPNFRVRWGEHTSVLQMLLILLTIFGYIPSVINTISHYYISIFI